MTPPSIPDAPASPSPSGALVPEAFRYVRALTPAEGPLPGSLAATDDGVFVLVDVARLAGWQGWRYAGSEHVLGPVDILRTADGHHALMPWCNRGLGAFISDRAGSGEPLHSGEACTLAVSLLRGMAELATERGSPIGRWWLTAQGRPLFAHGVGAEVGVGVVEHLRQVRAIVQDRPLGRVLEQLLDEFARPRAVLRDLTRWEDELLACAAPQPLRMNVYRPERVLGIPLVRDWSVAVPNRIAAVGDPDRSPPFSLDRLLAGIDHMRQKLRTLLVRRADADAVEPAHDERTHRPKRPLLIGGVAAVLVLAGGLLWPSVEPTAADSRFDDASVPDGMTAPGEATTTPDLAPPIQAASANAVDPAEAMPALLVALELCAAGDPAGCERAFGAVTDAEPWGLAVAGPGAHTVTLLDDYGDIAVFQLDPVSEGIAQTIVLARHDEAWLVRDIYDSVNQPG